PGRHRSVVLFEPRSCVGNIMHHLLIDWRPWAIAAAKDALGNFDGLIDAVGLHAAISPEGKTGGDARGDGRAADHGSEADIAAGHEAGLDTGLGMIAEEGAEESPAAGEHALGGLES